MIYNKNFSFIERRVAERESSTISRQKSRLNVVSTVGSGGANEGKGGEGGEGGGGPGQSLLVE